MNSPPFFSIITASYNSASTIRKTLVSVRGQTFPELEHIVVDGGSEDETPDMLREFQGTYPLIWSSEPDHGIAHALNKGLKKAVGRYIIVIQGDDSFLSSKTLESVFPLIKNGDSDICAFPVLYNPPVKGKKVGKPVQFLWWHRFRNIFPHQGVFVRRNVFDQVGLFNEKYAISMDYDFFYRALNLRCRVQYGDMPVAMVGGKGASADDTLLLKRLKEEYCIQKQNERKPLWRLSQLLFQCLYSPYKLWGLRELFF
ncbi:MAG: glycosyltransferase [Deltaproteobacteria bacterium]|nr:glycosyltransferase [Deltaproteobacteria bacterium]